MNQKQEALLGLPLTNAEREWLISRLETLSVKESYQLSAAIMRSGRLQELMGKSREELQVTVLRMKPDVAVEAINCLMTLHDYEVCRYVRLENGNRVDVYNTEVIIALAFRIRSQGATRLREYILRTLGAANKRPAINILMACTRKTDGRSRQISN